MTHCREVYALHASESERSLQLDETDAKLEVVDVELVLKKPKSRFCRKEVLLTNTLQLPSRFERLLN